MCRNLTTELVLAQPLLSGHVAVFGINQSRSNSCEMRVTSMALDEPQINFSCCRPTFSAIFFQAWKFCAHTLLYLERFIVPST